MNTQLQKQFDFFKHNTQAIVNPKLSVPKPKKSLASKIIKIVKAVVKPVVNGIVDLFQIAASILAIVSLIVAIFNSIQYVLLLLFCIFGDAHKVVDYVINDIGYWNVCLPLGIATYLTMFENEIAVRYARFKEYLEQD